MSGSLEHAGRVAVGDRDTARELGHFHDHDRVVDQRDQVVLAHIRGCLVEGVLGEVSGHISLVENESDVDALVLTPEQEAKIAVSTQTTLSQWDTRRVIEYIKANYPHAEVHIDICAATQTRQEAVVAQAKGADLTIVVGDPRSNNTNRLVQVSEELAGVPAIRIEDLSQLNTDWLKGKSRVAVTAGASTPSQLTREVIRFIEQYQPES